MSTWAVIAAMMLSTPMAEAKSFRNSYLRFQLPSQWGCKLNDTVWTCRYAVSPKCKGAKAKTPPCQKALKKRREAIIHLTAKETGPKDSIKRYLKYLKSPKTIITKDKRRISSKIIHLKSPLISGQTWVDGMHLGSELPNYYTRYLATVKGNVSVLVTFSAHKKYFSAYSTQFFETIKTLKVYSKAVKPKQLAKKTRQNINPGAMGPVSPMVSEEDFALDSEFENEDEEAGDHKTLIFGGLLAGLIAVIGMFIWAKRR